MAVQINITNRERIYINPYNARRIPRLTKGLQDDTDQLGEGGVGEEIGPAEGTVAENSAE